MGWERGRQQKLPVDLVGFFFFFFFFRAAMFYTSGSPGWAATSGSDVGLSRAVEYGRLHFRLFF